jgi:hypothetical protein
MAFVPFNGNSRFRPDPKPEPKEKAKPKKIKPRSEKRIEKDTVYHTLRDVFLKDKICQINQDNPAIEVHHTYSGKDRDKYYLDVKTWLAVCRDCHNWIHAHPAEARELGYLK